MKPRKRCARPSPFADGHSKRERQHIEAAEQIVAGNPFAALDRCKAHLQDFPRDAVLLQQWGLLNNSSGRQHRNEERVALLDELASDYGDDWYFLSLRAFSLEELDQFEQARRLAERALVRQPRSGMAVHAMAHVFYETTDHSGGVDFLGTWMEDYDRRAPMHCHFSWHLALHELARGHYTRVLELYQTGIGSALRGNRTSLNDAASLLWRQQIYGAVDAPPPGMTYAS